VKTLTINKLIFQNELKVEFSGAINEDADFKSLDSFDQSSISFDFGKVDMINSCGIREWIKFIEKVPETSQIIYRNCPQIIIEQLNMVHGFFKKGSIIESFCAPYFCETCDKENKVGARLGVKQDIIHAREPAGLVSFEAAVLGRAHHSVPLQGMQGDSPRRQGDRICRFAR
jgi:hypothetical protein